MEILHHGAVSGVTGSCHELVIGESDSVLVDCGLFQGAETAGRASRDRLEVDFPIDRVRALVATHVHIDHVGRIPYLLAAGFDGPIYCSQPSAVLLPLVLEDALKVGVTRDRDLQARILDRIRKQIRPLPYKQWTDLPLVGNRPLAVRLQRAGHILGSAYVEFRVGSGRSSEVVVFSGDLGAPWAPLLPAPKPPGRADVVVLERALRDRGTVLVPAFSIGRTQELLYELESIIHDFGSEAATRDLPWKELDIVVDSPLASRFTQVYRKLRPFWDQEALQRVGAGRHPLSFEQLTTVPDHQTHLQLVDYLSRTHRPAIVLAASGMCAGGRIVNYLKAMLGDPRHDVLFVGYQAQGTPGRDIQRYGPTGGYVELDGRRYDIRAGVHTLGGYSAHAGQDDLVGFVRRIPKPPRQVRLVHGDDEAKETLREKLVRLGTGIEVVVPEG